MFSMFIEAMLKKMNFPERLANARKEKGLTQQQLAELVGVHVVQIRRYEGGTCQPPFKLSLALNVSADRVQYPFMTIY